MKKTIAKKILGVFLLWIPWAFISGYLYIGIPPLFQALYVVLGGLIGGPSLVFGLILLQRQPKRV